MPRERCFPGIDERDLVLPTLLLHGLPVWLGALALAAVFSAEIGACEAILFMLSTSLSQDLYKRVVNPSATPAQVLTVARIAAFVGGSAGMLLAIFVVRKSSTRCRCSIRSSAPRCSCRWSAAVRPQAPTSRDALTSIVTGMIAFLADSVRHRSHRLVES